MSLPECAYCRGSASVTLGELWLCQVHGTALENHAGGLPELLEMSPEGRRALADTFLPRVVTEEVLEPGVPLED